jgi:hypothetical protein
LTKAASGTKIKRRRRRVARVVALFGVKAIKGFCRHGDGALSGFTGRQDTEGGTSGDYGDGG